MNTALEQHARSAAGISLIVFCVAVAGTLPPWNERFIHSPLMVILLGLVIACSLVLHLTFVGVLARSFDRSAARYVLLALLTLPIGSIVGLILLEWRDKVAAGARGEDTV